jgi:ABC-type dipeptide/oligopeptide/nickel transport system ATPase component
MVFVGEPRSGKSTLIKAVMQYYAKKKYFQFGICITGSKDNGDYTFLPDKAVWDNWNEDRFKEYIGVLDARKAVLNKKNKKLPPSFIIFDDLIGLLKTSDFYKSFLSRFRHYNVTVLLATQYTADAQTCSTLLRSVCDIAFMFPSMMENQLISMHKAWGMYYKKFHLFQDVMIKVKERKFACLLYQKKFNSIETCYKSFLCKPAAEDFKMNFDKKVKTDLPVYSTNELQLSKDRLVSEN